MLILTCPYCGVNAEETELHPGGEAHLARIGPNGTVNLDIRRSIAKTTTRNLEFSHLSGITAACLLTSNTSMGQQSPHMTPGPTTK